MLLVWIILNLFNLKLDLDYCATRVRSSPDDSAVDMAVSTSVEVGNLPPLNDIPWHPPVQLSSHTAAHGRCCNNK